jgi:hypothetical protein
MDRHLFSASLAELHCSLATTSFLHDWTSTHLGLKTRSLLYCLTVAGLLMWGALSDERMGLSFTRVTVSSSKSVVSMHNLHFTCY